MSAKTADGDLAKRALSGPDHADWLKMVLMFLPEQVDGEEIARNYSYWPGTTLGGIGERSARARARPPRSAAHPIASYSREQPLTLA